ncbi:transcriptional regulator with XRE-family HTH domain [Streptomyces sp. V3I8]|uniref:hypothetical protein n=1 Tax=Streptomyces sp. V3I8 TaxID=3042279 RepID=UPI002785335C|nr:hypothetical protein [Streptomyces sp. V3I8]MDQ1041442.1 transcriptional regulator with XRE-family HTH domain [Streptomyces sp. V3I8]
MAANVIASIAHPYWANLGYAVREKRLDLKYSQAYTAGALGLSVRDLAALESGFVPSDVAEALSRVSLQSIDEILSWREGTARKYVTEAVQAAITPSSTPGRIGFDRSFYSTAAWTRLGKAIQTARAALNMTRPVLAYAVRSSGKTILRLEQGRIYGDPRTAPPGDYNSEKYMLKRLSLLEMALEWEHGQARQILEGGTR